MSVSVYPDVDLLDKTIHLIVTPFVKTNFRPV